MRRLTNLALTRMMSRTTLKGGELSGGLYLPASLLTVEQASPPPTEGGGGCTGGATKE